MTAPKAIEPRSDADRSATPRDHGLVVIKALSQINEFTTDITAGPVASIVSDHHLDQGPTHGIGTHVRAFIRRGEGSIHHALCITEFASHCVTRLHSFRTAF